ncbi:hypothetical protein Q5P01_025755 [Channa striata]|uniref:RRM domain-containing protein n=1 Tax=Channa striata TaxID=64152 RepID=A0AA88J625_CHASR|nr:hypothetical protein Q5P01_025755 [Channa striata]
MAATYCFKLPEHFDASPCLTITASPSPVAHIRGLCDAVVEADLVEAPTSLATSAKSSSTCGVSPASSCSVHSYVMMMPFKRQALVEFDSVESAGRCQAFFNFSTSQRITRPTNADDPASGNKVLLLSVQNPLYPITTVSPAESHVRACWSVLH